MIAGRDAIADSFDETERRLNEWGAACRRNNAALGLPTIASFAQMAAKIREDEQKLKGVRKKALRKKIKAQSDAEQPVDCKDVSQAKGLAELDTTAQGKESRSLYERRLTLDSDVMQVDKVIRGLPGWMQTPLFRTYLYSPQQPFRIAARELRMDTEHYQSQWKAAVKQVAAKLAERQAGAVK